MTTRARWVVDANGRAFMLKKKLDLFEENGHVINAAWFRLAGGLDIEDWADPSDEEFFGRMEERGLRRLSTNHICGKGYWVWLIPLSSGPISIGIVADPRFHPWEGMNTLEGALDWIREHEPQLAESIDGRVDKIEDFLSVQDFSYGCKQTFSGSDRWVLVGESGAFLDPFYSPGSDYIAMANTFATDLITRELDGEDVTERAKAHDDLYRSAYRTHLTFYEKQYEFWHNPAVMNVKIGGNNILYWGADGLLFFHRKLTDVEFMAAVRPDVERIWALNRRLETMYREWNAIEVARVAPRDCGDVRLPGDVRAAHGPRRGLRRRGAAGAARREHRADGGLHGARLPPRRPRPCPAARRTRTRRSTPTR